MTPPQRRSKCYKITDQVNACVVRIDDGVEEQVQDRIGEGGGLSDRLMTSRW